MRLNFLTIKNYIFMKNLVANSRTTFSFLTGLFTLLLLFGAVGQSETFAANGIENPIIEKNNVRDVATNFEVIIKNKNGGLTGSHKRAKKIAVYFDIKGLSETKHGEQELFLVIKDSKGMNVAVKNPVNTQVGLRGEVMNISAQQSMTATLDSMNRLKFEVKPKKRSLKEGMYTVSVYSKAGLLGSSEFSLR